MAQNSLGWRACEEGNYERALALHQETLALRREIGLKLPVRQSLHNLGIVLLRQKAYKAAYDCFREALLLAESMNNQFGVIECVEKMGCMAAVWQQAETAVLLFGAAYAMRIKISGTAAMDPMYKVDIDAVVTLAQQTLSEAELTAVHQRGRTLSETEAINYALSQIQVVE